MAKQRPQGTSSGVLIITPFERSSTCLLEFKGLGGDNNSDLSLFRTDLERALARIDPIRDVNWRRSPKDCISSTQLRATHVQRFGHELPLRGYCERCANNDGPVASCAVTVMDMKPVFGGACADCAFGGGQSRCSFRLDKDGLPQYLVYILRTDNPEDGDTKESKKERTAPPSVPVHAAPVRNARVHTARVPTDQSISLRPCPLAQLSCLCLPVLSRLRLSLHVCPV